MKFINKYSVILWLGISDAFEYRINFFIQVFSWYFPLAIQILLWKAIYASTGKTVVAGYSLNMIIVYYITVMIINEIIKTESIEWGIVADIRDGGLQKYLLQPISYLIYQFVYVLSKKVIVIGCIFINIIPLILIFGENFSIALNYINCIKFMITLFCALVIMFLLNSIIAMLSFWFTEFSSVFHFLPFGISLLNGTTLPLNIFPDMLANFLKYTPFYYMVYFPAQVLNGQVINAEFYKGIIILLTWIAIGCILCGIVWKRGIRHFSATGG